MRAATLLLALLLALALAPASFGAQQRSDFDHLTTGFELTGRHRDLPCEECHATAIFKGTPRDCAACHGLGGNVRATAKPTNHILSTDQCDSCHATVAWIPAVNFDHAQTHGSCSMCHNNAQARGKGPQHLSTTLECNVCHSTFTWSGAVFNHEGITGGCAQCHNGVTASGLPNSHIPTGGAPCESCHSATNFATFAGAVMDHSVVAGMPCANCHEAGRTFLGVTITTRPPAPHPMGGDCSACHTSTSTFTGLGELPPNHIPTTQPCSQCHSNAADFSIYTMSHQGITSSCANCHGASLSFLNMAPPTLKVFPANHIPTGSVACEGCHSTSNFTTFSGTAMNHAVVTAIACSTCHEAGKSFVGSPPVVTRPPAPHPVTGDCGACHTTSTFSGATQLPANHIPTSQTCSTCHSNLADFTIYKMSHQGITSGCATCHAAALSFLNMAPPTLKEFPANHIPTGSIACESCHSKTNFTSFAGTTMNHAVVTAIACSTCHEAGKSFVGSPPVVTRPPAPHPVTGDCGACHTTSTFSGATQLPANHIPTSQACSTCHSNLADFSIYKMSHQGITSGCATCHAAGLSFLNMAPPTLKEFPANHIPTGSIACESCHSKTNFMSFAGTTMNHAVVTAIACSTCHEAGKSFVGSPPIVTRPPAPHPVTGDCGACHTTSTFSGATQLPANHIPTSQACSTCHSNLADFTIYKMSHQGITSGCATCHAAGLSFLNMAPPTLKEFPANHIPTGSIACESCHSKTNFTSFAGTAMNHAVVTAIACSTCHEAGKSFVGSPPIVTRPPAPHPVTGECGACHTTATFSGATQLPANHIPTSQACSTCHSNLADFTIYKMSHQGITSGCATCHAAGLSFLNMAPPTLKEFPANHIPTGSIACESCHSKTNFTTFSGTAMNHAVVTAIGCSTCHEAGKSFVGSPPIVTRPPAPHVTTGQCSNCHLSTTTFAGAAGSLPANHIPLPAADAGNCSLCHTNANDFSIYTMNHSGIANNCAQCHGAGLSFANIGPPALKQPPTGSPAHIPTGNIACESCHAATNFTTFAGTVIKHAAVAGQPCVTCHELGMSWYGISNLWVRPGANHHKGQDCGGSGCHTPRDRGGAAALAAAAKATVKAKAAASVPSTATVRAAGAVGTATGALRSGAVGGAHDAGAGGLAATSRGLGAAAGAAGVTAPVTLGNGGATSGLSAAIRGNSATSGGLAGAAAQTAVTNTNGRTTSGLSAAAGANSAISGGLAGAAGQTAMAGSNGGTTAGLGVPTGGLAAAAPGQAAAGANNSVTTAGPGPGAVAVAGTPGTAAGGLASAGGPTAPAGRGLDTTSARLGGAASPIPRAAIAIPNASFGGTNHPDTAGARCVTCHRASVGASRLHAATTTSCESCHTTLAWLPVIRVDHLQVRGPCATCHNGTIATGMPRRHVAAKLTCDVCHTTNAWTPARFDHLAGAPQPCSSCHDRVHASGLPRNHIPTTKQCDACHGTLAWTPVRLDHSSLTTGCATCHNNAGAVGKAASHMSTARECTTCHTYPDWNTVNFRHATAQYPGQHHVALSCDQCHTANSEHVVYAAPADAGTCGGCHARSFKPDAHPKTVKGQLYTASELADCTGACHVYSDSTRATIAKAIRGPYHRVTDAAFRH